MNQKSLDKKKPSTVIEQDWEKELRKKFSCLNKENECERCTNCAEFVWWKEFTNKAIQSKRTQLIDEIVELIDEQFVSKELASSHGIMSLVADCLYDEKKELKKQIISLKEKV